MITQDGRNACLRMNFCGMPTVTWYINLITQDDEVYTDSADFPFLWSNKTFIDATVQGTVTLKPNSEAIITKVQLYNDTLIYAEYDIEPVTLETGKTITLLIPVGWR